MSPVTDTAPTLVSSAEAARVLNRSRKWVVRAATRGDLPVYGKMRGLTGAYLFDLAMIEALRREQKAS